VPAPCEEREAEPAVFAVLGEPGSPRASEEGREVEDWLSQTSHSNLETWSSQMKKYFL